MTPPECRHKSVTINNLVGICGSRKEAEEREIRRRIRINQVLYGVRHKKVVRMFPMGNSDKEQAVQRGKVMENP